MQMIIDSHQLSFSNGQTISFDYTHDLVFHQQTTLPKHANGMRFTAYDAENKVIQTEIYYSIGGGFIVTDDTFGQQQGGLVNPPYPFSTGKQLLTLCQTQQLHIWQVMLANERCLRDDGTIREAILQLYV